MSSRYLFCRHLELFFSFLQAIALVQAMPVARPCWKGDVRSNSCVEFLMKSRCWSANLTFSNIAMVESFVESEILPYMRGKRHGELNVGVSCLQYENLLPWEYDCVACDSLCLTILKTQVQFCELYCPPPLPAPSWRHALPATEALTSMRTGTNDFTDGQSISASKPNSGLLANQTFSSNEVTNAYIQIHRINESPLSYFQIILMIMPWILAFAVIALRFWCDLMHSTELNPRTIWALNTLEYQSSIEKKFSILFAS